MTHDDRGAGHRIADAVHRLRDRGVVVEQTTQAGATTYVIERLTYRAEVVVDPLRWLGLEFDLLAQDQSVVLHYGVDTDLYNISLPKYWWFAEEIETDIVLLLDGLAQGRILVDKTAPRPSMIVPSGGGPVLVRRLRFGATTGLYKGADSSLPPGFEILDP